MALRSLNSAISNEIYSELHENQIRVIRIAPSPNFFDPLECCLLTVALNSNFQYDALSYVWGSQERPRTITLEGKEFNVTRNLHRALARIRLPRMERLVWIDALSINQCSIPERNSQVLLMTKIYAQAKLTIAWLGDSFNPEILELLAFISRAGNAVLDNFASRDPKQKMELMRITASFTLLPYWTRAWVFQEAVASKELIFQYGDTILSMAALTKFWGLIESHARVGADARVPASDISTPSMYMMMINNIPLQLLQSLGSESCPLFNYIDWVYEFCLKRKCENPRDKVFAAFSLFPHQVRKDIKVDYSLDVHTVFADATRSFIEDSGDIAPLLQCFDLLDGYNSLSSSSPSWVPNYMFRSTETYCERVPLLLHDTRRKEERLKSSRFPPDEPLFSFSSDGKVLKLSAYHIGSTAQISPPFTSAVPRLGSWRGDYTNFGSESTQKLQAYSRQCEEVLNVSNEDLLSFLCTIGLLKWLNLDAALSIGALLSCSKAELETIMRDEHDLTSQSYLFLCTSMPFMHYRRSIFVFRASVSLQSPRPHTWRESEFARLMDATALYGIGPEEMWEGDQVYVMPGHDMPIVVRPTIGGFKLIGNAHLAILHGADWFWERLSSNSLGLQEICLI